MTSHLPTNGSGILERFRLDGRVALVTGAARGLGQALAMALAEAGAGTALVDCLPCEETAGMIRALRRTCATWEADLREIEADGARELVRQVVGRLGRLDILVNAAGIIRRAPAEEMQPQDWEDVLRLDLSSVFVLSQAAARHFIAEGQGGKIIQIASMLSFQGGYRVASYAAAKSGVAGLTRALANEWAQHGINVNAIAPGYFATAVTAALRADPIRNQDLVSRIPAGRWGEPSDLAGAAVFLASSASDYVHGILLPVDGGWLSW